MTDTLILCAGKINYLHFPMATNTSNAMIPINGKPVIAWLLEDLIAKKITEITIVLRKEDKKLHHFITKVFADRLRIELVLLKQSNSILESISSGLKACKGQAVRIILGDTLITDSYDGKKDMVYIQAVTESHRWCIAETNTKGEVVNYWDKEFEVPQPLMAICGYYHLTNRLLVAQLVASCIKNNKNQISDLLIAYQNKKPIKGVLAKSWFDFGNLDNLIKAKQQLLQSRHFNSLTIDPVLNTITKLSEFDEKLRRELAWYEKLPKELQVLTPRIIDKKQVNGKLHLTQEYYGYPNLAELYLFSDLDLDSWESIFRNLFAIHNKFKTYQRTLDSKHLKSMYWDKTIDRLVSLKEQREEWRILLEDEKYLYVNSKKIRNLPLLLSWLEDKVAALVHQYQICIIHGDFCFGNILYDINGQIVRLIDPRGSFGEQGIYGDPRYDLAKLRHSINGHYDYIVGDMFNLSQSDNNFRFSMKFGTQYEPLKTIFDKMLLSNGYIVEEIILIEALLFLSMIPLHKDNEQRQKAMYLTGIDKLNYLYENSN